MPPEGILPVITTPLRDGEFDAESFQRLLDHMLPWTDGYTLLGSTGEAPSLTTEERLSIAERALAMTPADKQVVVGVTHTIASESAALAAHAQAHGAAGVLCAVPYYFPNTPAGILRHLEEVHAVLEVDLVLYDNPVATKTTLAADDVIDWSQRLDGLTGVKLTDHDLGKVERWHDAGLRVFAGDDVIVLRYLDAGVDGAMVIAPSLFPEAFRRVWDLFREGELEEALAIAGRSILPFLHVFGLGDEIATTKAALADAGIFASDELLPPLAPVDERRRRLLAAAWDACGGRERTARGRA